MQSIHILAFGVCCMAALRLLDKVWPTKTLSWKFYAGEMLIAAGVMIYTSQP